MLPISINATLCYWASQVGVRCCESWWLHTSYFLGEKFDFGNVLKCPFLLASSQRSCYWNLYCLLIHHPALSVPQFLSSLPCFFPLLVSCFFLCELESDCSRLICHFKAICFVLSLGSSLCIWSSPLYSEFMQSEPLPFISSNDCLKSKCYHSILIFLRLFGLNLHKRICTYTWLINGSVIKLWWIYFS